MELNTDETAEFFRDLAKHAPQATPTDEAKLREVIQRELLYYNKAAQAELLKQSDREFLIVRLTAALTPHLAPGEPSDSELLEDFLAIDADESLDIINKALEEHASWNGAGQPMNASAWATITLGGLRQELFNIRKAAMRGEGEKS